MDVLDSSQIQKGDKIVLKTTYGPENSVNSGIVEEVSAKGVLTNFGLKYSYRIPFSSIKIHLKSIHNKSGTKADVNKKEKSINQIKL